MVRPPTFRPLVSLAVLVAVLMLAAGARTAAGQAATASPDSAAAPAADAGVTRTERLVELRRARRERLHPPETGWLEETVAWLEEKRDRLRAGSADPDLFSISPVLGGLQGGAGLTAGLKLDVTRGNPNSLLTLAARGSIKRYWGTSATLGYDAGRGVGYGYLQFRHMPKEEFFGIGMDASREFQSDFRRDKFIGGGLVGVRPLPRMMIGAHASYMTNRVGPGLDDDLPDVPDRFGPGEIPALGEDVDYLVVGGYAELDRRAIPHDDEFGRRFAPTDRELRGISMDARSGYFFAVEVSHFFDRVDGLYDFTRAEFEAQQFIPFRRGHHVVALRELVSWSEDRDVPFYLMQSLGGKYTLRGFTDERFRDVHALLFNAEYRYEVWRLLDVALFADAGQVFHHFRQIGPANAVVGYGVGLRLKTPESLFARIDLARSVEGFEVYLSLSSPL